jgi:subtilisin family serine protease
MDPALLEILRNGTTGRGDEVEAIIRLDRPNEGVAGVRIVSRFGPIATCRLHRDSIISTRQADRVVSLKAPRLVGPEYGAGGRKRRSSSVDNDFRDSRRPSGMRLTGAGVVVGVIDWGCDFDHPNFKHTDGSTRLVSLWDQRGPTTSTGPRPYGYGAVYGVRQIDDALRAADPYDALGYHPAEADPDGSGAHGTHVMDIAAGNGLGGGPLGIAPEADLVFVHLADPGTSGLANLGDSVRILEAVDFISRVAGGRSWVINSGVGRHGGPHDGTTLAEQDLDYTLRAAPGRFIVQSAGNYFDKSTHASGQLASGQMRCLTFVTHEAGVTANEVEVWYSGDDELAVRVESPTGERTPWVPYGGQEDVLENDRVVGRVYHRARDPNNGDNHVELFLDPWARSGSWEMSLQAWTIRNGTFHAWLERDEASVQRQSHFVESDVDRTYTTGTIANGHLPLVVGAYDAHLPTREVAPFSSAGPTRDGRSKPDLVAPGVQVLAARSAPLDSSGSPGLFARKSGTSMAAPHVAGVVALCLQGAPRRLAAEEIRDLLLSNVERVDAEERSSPRFGRGCLSVGNVVAAVSSPRRDV